MNWGYRIVLIYVLFVAGIIFMVYKSATQKVDLVTSDYYEQELQYQNKIDQVARVATLSSDVSIIVKKGSIGISFPKEMQGKLVKAEVMLYCPSDNKKDITRSFDTDKGELVFYYPISYKGQFDMNINWKVDEVTYYSSEKIFIQ